MRLTAVIVLFIAALMGEQIILEGTPMPTVTGFEIEEEGLSTVLTNAMEDQRAVVDCMVASGDDPYVGANQFRAIRVLRLLEALRDREAGGVA